RATRRRIWHVGPPPFSDRPLLPIRRLLVVVRGGGPAPRYVNRSIGVGAEVPSALATRTWIWPGTWAGDSAVNCVAVPGMQHSAAPPHDPAHPPRNSAPVTRPWGPPPAGPWRPDGLVTVGTAGT